MATKGVRHVERARDEDHQLVLEVTPAGQPDRCSRCGGEVEPGSRRLERPPAE